MKVKELIRLAIEAQQQSYSPYMNFKVGAALLTKSGKVFTGCNVENVCGTSNCAERTAVFKAVSAGEKEFTAIAIKGDSDYCFPCGICRQVLVEFSPDMKVFVVKDENDYKTYTAGELLPFYFSPKKLKD